MEQMMAIIQLDLVEITKFIGYLSNLINNLYIDD